MKWWGGAGWRISNAESGRQWGHAYAEMPTALLDELNGQCRLNVCLELASRLKKTDWRYARENRGMPRTALC